MTYLAKTQHRNPCPRGHEFYILVDPSLVILTMCSVCLMYAKEQRLRYLNKYINFTISCLLTPAVTCTYLIGKDWLSSTTEDVYGRYTTTDPLWWRRSKAFASHAGDRGSISVATEVVNTGSDSSTAKCTAKGVCHGSSEMTNIKGRPVSQQVWHVKEHSLLNGHECRAKVKICSPSLAIVTSL